MHSSSIAAYLDCAEVRAREEQRIRRARLLLNRLVPLRAPFDERSWSRKKSGSNEEDLSMTDHFWIQLR